MKTKFVPDVSFTASIIALAIFPLIWSRRRLLVIQDVGGDFSMGTVIQLGKNIIPGDMFFQSRRKFGG